VQSPSTSNEEDIRALRIDKVRALPRVHRQPARRPGAGCRPAASRACLQASPHGRAPRSRRACTAWTRPSAGRRAAGARAASVRAGAVCVPLCAHAPGSRAAGALPGPACRRDGRAAGALATPAPQPASRSEASSVCGTGSRFWRGLWASACAARAPGTCAGGTCSSATARARGMWRASAGGLCRRVLGSTPHGNRQLTQELQGLAAACMRRRGAPLAARSRGRHRGANSHSRPCARAQGEEVAVAGRVMARRVMGKLAFVRLEDGSGSVQLYVDRATLDAAQPGGFRRGAAAARRALWPAWRGGVRRAGRSLPTGSRDVGQLITIFVETHISRMCRRRAECLSLLWVAINILQRAWNIRVEVCGHSYNTLVVLR